MQSPRFVEVACQVCGSSEAEPVYERELETAGFGRVRMRLVLCASCGFLFQSPRPAPALLARHYRTSDSASGAVWHADGASSRHARLAAERGAFAGRALESAGVGRSEGTVLDAGCAQGDFLAALALRGWRKVGLEPSAGAAARARARGLEVHEGTLEWNELASERFDLVTCWSVLEHVWDVREALGALERLVRPGGALALYVPDSSRPVAQVAEFFSFEHLSHFTGPTLARALAGFGFRALALEQSGDSGLFVAARREGRRAGVPVPLAREPVDVCGALAHYRRERENFERALRARFEALAREWRARSARVALHGAGEHTRFLLDLVDLSEVVVAILDSDPEKHGRPFLRWTVRPPAEAPALGVRSIVLSSRPFQEEMAAALAPLAGEHGIELVRCYPEIGRAG